MRYLWMCLTLLMPGWAQETPESQEVPEAAEEAPPPPHWRRTVRWKSNFYLELGYNQFLGLPADLATTIQGLGSIKLNLQGMEMLRIGKAFYIASGSGIAIREVRFEKNAILYRDTTGFLTYTFDTLPAAQGYSTKSKFQLAYLRVPLETGILYKGFQLAAYGYGDLLLWVFQKRKYTDKDEKTKFVLARNKNYGTEPLQYGIGGRVGYRGIGVFANYNLSPLWRSTKGPDNVRPFQVGIYFFDSLYKKRKSPTKRSGYSS